MTNHSNGSTSQMILKPLPRKTPVDDDVKTVFHPDINLDSMVLSSELRSSLDRLVLEYRQQAKLKKFGLSARRKILLIGPPGCGKTMCAGALAGELGLPLCYVPLHAAISRYMGETAQNLFGVFQTMKREVGVYFFDEFDALATSRDSKGDGPASGEAGRIVNSLLTFIEQDESDSLIIAATNHGEMLDSALFRRFDDVLHYDHPTAQMAKRLIYSRLKRFKLSKLTQIDQCLEICKSLSLAEVAKACDEAAKSTVLLGALEIDQEALMEALSARVSMRRSIKID